MQIKNAMSPEKYSVFLKTFLAYNTNSEYKTFIDSLFSIFGENQLHYILRGMIRFVRATHRESYEKDVNQFILNHT